MRKRILLLAALLLILFVSLPAGAAPAGDGADGVRAGDFVTFGRYEQDRDFFNRQEPIRWIVLDVQDGRALLLSQYALIAKPYNDTKGDVTWETCSLRKWLNEDFLNSAFSTEELESILEAEVDNGPEQGNADYSTDGGNSTRDRVFLLSYAEAGKYLTWKEARVCRPTRFAHPEFTKNGNCQWWLRSPGYKQDYAAYVGYNGSFKHSGTGSRSTCVRPAVWIELEPGLPESAELSLTDPNAAVSWVPGYELSLGRYEQDNNPSNGLEEMKWTILDVQEGRVLLLGKYGLDAVPYNDGKGDVTWETCSLRKWLNGDFLDSAFSAEERDAILTAELENGKSEGYPGFETDGGSRTQDRVFLLSYAEVERYFPAKPPAVGYTDLINCSATPYAAERCKTVSGTDLCFPWLRSPGREQDQALTLGYIGTVLAPYGSENADRDSFCVQPAVWVDPESEIFRTAG